MTNNKILTQEELKEKEKQEAIRMCNTCAHNNYCAVAYLKDHWRGNYKKKTN